MKLMNQQLAKTKYLCGDELTIGDIAAYCEIVQGAFLPEGKLPTLDRNKNVVEWMERVGSVKEVAEVHKPMLKIASMARRRSAASPKL